MSDTRDARLGAQALQGRVILLVEDQALIAMELELVLENAGAEVKGPVATLRDATEAAHRADFDAALLDLDLAGEDAIGIADILVARGIPFVFHTGHGKRAELEAAYTAAIVCAKPSTPERVIEALASALRS